MASSSGNHVCLATSSLPPSNLISPLKSVAEAFCVSTLPLVASPLDADERRGRCVVVCRLRSITHLDKNPRLREKLCFMSCKFESRLVFITGLSAHIQADNMVYLAAFISRTLKPENFIPKSDHNATPGHIHSCHHHGVLRARPP